MMYCYRFEKHNTGLTGRGDGTEKTTTIRIGLVRRRRESGPAEKTVLIIMCAQNVIITVVTGPVAPDARPQRRAARAREREQVRAPVAAAVRVARVLLVVTPVTRWTGGRCTARGSRPVLRECVRTHVVVVLSPSSRSIFSSTIVVVL